MELENLQQYFESKLTEFQEREYPKNSRLSEAISYALCGQGKRVRPLLVLMMCEALGGKKEQAIEAAIALEMIHTYSLVHDDMPLLDNDSLRRGRKTVHVVYDEQTALLVGNSLLTDAFFLLTKSENLSSLQKEKMVGELSLASGSKGMLLGQSLDLYWTARNNYTKEDLDRIHLKKTGALLGCACALGAIAAGVLDQSFLGSCKKLGELVGQSFQITDDLLDESDKTGKSSGKDKKQGKLTYLKIYDKKNCEKEARRLTSEALIVFSSLPLVNSHPLSSFFSSLLDRKF